MEIHIHKELSFDELREQILRKLKKKLTDKRYDHTLRVENTALMLAHIYGANTQIVSLAALLHDNAKNYSDEKKLRLCKEYKVPLSAMEEENIDLVHSKLGAVLAYEKYGIRDQDVLNAISYHTTGRPEMSLVEKIIYVSDFIEPGRKEFPGLQKARELCFRNLDLGLMKILMLTINHLLNQGKLVDPITERTYEHYFELCSAELEVHHTHELQHEK